MNNLTELLQESPIVELNHPYGSISIKREDLMHPTVSGNKLRKLKYNLAFAKANDINCLLTFGGAYSNHIAATAAAANIEGLESVGIIRGEELGVDLNKTLMHNPTLRYAHAQGMRFEFISRSDYKKKEDDSYLHTLKNRYPEAYVIPEGGTNDLAIKGCTEILGDQTALYDILCCSAGTGGTVSGIINAALPHQKVFAFSALKGDFLKSEIQKRTSGRKRWELVTDYHFGGYAQVNKELVDFINTFKKEQHIPLDPVYTGKMMYGVFDMVRTNIFPKNSRILAIHTGGLQGIPGMNQKLKKKGLPEIW